MNDENSGGLTNRLISSESGESSLEASNRSKLITHPSDGDEEAISELSPIKSEQQDLVEFEFKVGGMTCVACSSSVERLMHNEFDSRGMVSVTIVLLTHKMFA